MWFLYILFLFLLIFSKSFWVLLLEDRCCCFIRVLSLFCPFIHCTTFAPSVFLFFLLLTFCDSFEHLKKAPELYRWTCVVMINLQVNFRHFVTNSLWQTYYLFSYLLKSITKKQTLQFHRLAEQLAYVRKKQIENPESLKTVNQDD